MCLSCNIPSKYLPSPRKHGQPPRKFFLCANCGSEVQGVEKEDGTIREFTTSVYKGGTHVVPVRLNDNQYDDFINSGRKRREIFLTGLYKSDTVSDK